MAGCAASKQTLHVQGLCTIGPHVVGPFCEIVKLRNRLAKLCGAEDFYDYTVKQAEGFSKRCARGRVASLIACRDRQSCRSQGNMHAHEACLPSKCTWLCYKPYCLQRFLSSMNQAS